MKERPALFNAPMVRAILEGRKTQTRRVLKPQPAYPGIERFVFEKHPFAPSALKGTPAAGIKIAKEGKTWLAEDWCKNIVAVLGDCPYGQPGDRLWVRETYAIPEHWDSDPAPKGDWVAKRANIPVRYAADGAMKKTALPWHIGKSRPSIFMPRWASRILLEITEVRVERLQEISLLDADAEGYADDQTTARTSRGCFKDGAWASKYWNANPWVWVLTFRRVKA